jgi:sugar lactone lactonase YvrE
MRQQIGIARDRRWPAITIAALVGFVGAVPLASAQPAQISFADTLVFPESLTSTADGTIIIGSLDHGTVYRVAPGGTTAVSWIKAAPNGLTHVLGVFANDAADTLWVCNDELDPAVNKAELRSFGLKDGTAKARYSFPGGGLCNDIAIAKDGTVFATDTRGGRILALKPGATELAVWGSDQKWKGIDGIALARDGSVIFNNVRENQLVRVEMKSDGGAGPWALLDLSSPIAGPDGMRALSDGRFLLAENRAGKIDVVAIEAGKAKIDTIRDGFKSMPTAVTLVGGTVWVVEAKLNYRNDPALKGQDPGPFFATPVALPAQ